MAAQAGGMSRLTWPLAAVVTACAFIGLHDAGLLGTVPLPVLLAMLAVTGLASELVSRRWYAAPGGFAIVIGTQMLAITVIIYAIGWGPTLAIGYLFPLGEVLRDRGSSSWRVAYGASVGPHPMA